MAFHGLLTHPAVILAVILFIFAGVVAVALRGPPHIAAVTVLTLLLVMLSVIEIVTIPLSLVPVVGDLFGALSETLIEVIQAVGIILIGFAGVIS